MRRLFWDAFTAGQILTLGVAVLFAGESALEGRSDLTLSWAGLAAFIAFALADELYKARFR